MRLLYLGLPLGAVWLARHGIDPAIVALGHPDAPGTRRVRLTMGARGALILGRPDLDDPEVLRLILSRRPDAALSFFWPRRIPNALLEALPLGAYGTHPSLLPRWPGPDPYYWAVREGDRESGVSLHRLDAEYDTGAIIRQTRVPLHARETGWTLARRLDRPALSLLVSAGRALSAASSPLPGEAQPAGDHPWAGPPDEATLSLDWSLPAETLERHVRAAHPAPLASMSVRGVTWLCERAEVADTPPPAALRPSEAFRDRDGEACVVARPGALRILWLRCPTTDERRRGVEIILDGAPDSPR